MNTVYNFNVISLFNLDSNIPISAAHSVIYSQVLKATNSYEYFMDSLSELRRKMIRQNISKSGAEKEFRKFLSVRSMT